MIDHIIPGSVQAMSLARYLARAWPMLPGFAAREAFKKKDVRVNGEKAGGDSMVRGGDQLRLYLPDRYLGGTLNVLYHDEHILAVEKPAGLPVDVDADGVGVDTLITRARLIDSRAALCHRLDAGTGGVLLLALDGDAQRRLERAFRDHQVAKTYRAVVAGHPPECGKLTHYLVKDADGARVRVYDAPRPGAQTAMLSYRVKGRLPGFSLVEIDLITGRTHQIRAQMAAAGHPLVGDDKYGSRQVNREQGAASPLLWCVAAEYEGLRVCSAAQWGAKWTFA